MLKHIEKQIEGRIGLDWQYQTEQSQKGLCLFIHGLKGFKDWGCWNVLGRHFAQKNLVFAKLTLSGAGLKGGLGSEFNDPEGFGHSHFGQDLDDVYQVLEQLQAEFKQLPICLIGHSKGGGLALIAASEQKGAISRLISWASVPNMGWLFSPERVQSLKEKGVFYLLNQRTGQSLPIYANAYQTYLAQLNRFDLNRLAKELNLAWLLIHGDQDQAIPLNQVQTWLEQAKNPLAELKIIPNADHVFGAKQPHNSQELPKASQTVLELSLDFLKNWT